MAAVEDVVHFGGHRFVRHPNAKSRSARVYYTAYEGGQRAKGVGQLHVEVWRAAHAGAEVPAGHVIHHVDFDPLNNDPVNLVCLTYKEHAEAHRGAVDRESPEWSAHLAAIRPLSVEWHRSPEGREWHREHGRRTMAARPLTEHTCEGCQRKYTSRAPAGQSRTCSRNCVARVRRREHGDDDRVICRLCGSEFWQNRYSHIPETCSRRCGAALRRERRTTTRL